MQFAESEFPELTFADLPAMVRDPTDNKLLEDVVTQVILKSARCR